MMVETEDLVERSNEMITCNSSGTPSLRISLVASSDRLNTNLHTIHTHDNDIRHILVHR